jgi:hypothetical protein|tara:strand:+ start:1129 stop:1314 length:186 start_codon:yes stop_codon:yes gene_type:complete
MEYPELKVYDTFGGDNTIKTEFKEELNENDKEILRKYRKRIIEQRNKINELEDKIKKLTKK